MSKDGVQVKKIWLGMLEIKGSWKIWNNFPFPRSDRFPLGWKNAGSLPRQLKEAHTYISRNVKLQQS